MGVFPILFVVDCQPNIVAIDFGGSWQKTKLEFFGVRGNVASRLLPIERIDGSSIRLEDRLGAAPFRKDPQLRV